MENETGQEQKPKRKPARIIRAPRKTHPYFMFARKTAQDKSLTWEALGVLTYLLSKPDHWETKISDLQQRKGCGRDKARGIMKQLQDAGYLVKVPRQTDGGLLAGWDWHVYELPVATVLRPSRKTVKPYDGKPVPLDNTEGEDNTDKTSLSRAAIDAKLKIEIGVKILGYSEAIAQKDKYAGILAQVAAGYWRAHLGVEKLTADQYAKITRSIDPFIADWNTTNKGRLNLPTGRDTFGTAYGKFVTRVTTGKADNGERHYDPNCQHCHGDGIRQYADGADECECYKTYKLQGAK